MSRYRWVGAFFIAYDNVRKLPFQIGWLKNGVVLVWVAGVVLRIKDLPSRASPFWRVRIGHSPESRFCRLFALGLVGFIRCCDVLSSFLFVVC